MLTHKDLNAAISEAEHSFRSCWQKLLLLSTQGNDKSKLAEAVFSFQPTLGTALYKLEVLYNTACKEARELVSRKSALNQAWFRGRLRALDGHKRLICYTIDVGKALGDSFAWLFDRNERELLRRHHAHASTPHLPTGVGGRGNLSLLGEAPSLAITSSWPIQLRRFCGWVTSLCSI